MITFYQVTSPCTSNPCSNSGTCSISSQTGGYICSCLSGFTGPNCLTLNISPCTNFPCQNGGTCQVNGTNYVCYCLSGYSGTNCQICNFTQFSPIRRCFLIRPTYIDLKPQTPAPTIHV